MNLPNKLTVIRIVLIPLLVLVWLFPYQQIDFTFNELTVGDYSINYLNLILLLIFSIASITDYFDGKIARKRKLITTFGKFADPIADKLLVNTMFIIMAYQRMIPVLPVVIMIARDTIVDCCRMIASQHNKVIAAGFLGKLKTVLQIVSIIFILLNNLPFEIWGLPISDILLWFASFVSAFSGYQYFVQTKEFIFESM